MRGPQGFAAVAAGADGCGGAWSVLDAAAALPERRAIVAVIFMLTSAPVFEEYLHDGDSYVPIRGSILV